MNKQRYLAELRRLLVFMTDSDRDITMKIYTERFDSAGEAGEEKLLVELGSPTKQAIILSRGYQPGQITVEARQRKALAEAERKARVIADNYDPGDVAADIPSLPEIEVPAAAEETAEEDEEPEAPEITEEEDEEEDGLLPNFDRDSRPVVYKRQGASVSRGVGITLLTLILLVAGVPLAALTVLLAAVLLCPGVVGIFGAGLVAIGALWCIGYVADAFLLLGAAFVVLGAALLLLFGGVHLAVLLVKLYIRAVAGLCDGLLGRKAAVE